MTTETYQEIVDYLRRAIDATEWEGHVFAVGGCCRDAVMGRPINDIDLAVDIPNGGVLFGRWLHRKGLTVFRPTEFERYGTSMLALKAFPQEEIELVQTRKGQYARQGAPVSPESVFGSLEDDALRRDFTINTLFYNISTGEMIDKTGLAIPDIESGILRTPLPPSETFSDDPVRILRAIRMSASLNRTVDKATMQAMRDNIAGLDAVSIERQRGELEKMLMCADPARAVSQLRKTGLLARLAPELGRLYQRGSSTLPRVFDRSMRGITQVAPRHNIAMSWAVLLWPLYDRHRKHNARQKTAEENAQRRQRRIFDPWERLLRRLHHHSKFVNSVKFLFEKADMVRSWQPDLSGVKNRHLTGLRRACVSAEKLSDTLDYIELINTLFTPDDTYARQVRMLRQRLSDAPVHPAPQPRQGAPEGGEQQQQPQKKKKRHKKSQRQRRNARKRQNGNNTQH